MTVVRLTSGLTGGRSVVPTSIVLEDLDSRANCWTIINAAWGQLAFACLVVILGVVGVPLQIAFGDSVTTVVASVTAGTGFFCLAGCANALWRMYWFLPKARRHATGRRDVYEKALGPHDADERRRRLPGGHRAARRRDHSDERLTEPEARCATVRYRCWSSEFGAGSRR